MLTELVLYRTLPGVTAEDHEPAAVAAHRSFLVRQEGFLGRVLGRIEGKTDEWVDMVRWQTADNLRAAMKSAKGDGSMGTWMGQVDERHVSVRTLLTYGTVGLTTGALDDPATGCWVVCSWKTRPDIDSQNHQAGNERSHLAMLSTIAGYLGALMMREGEEAEWIDAMKWSDVASAKAGVDAAVGSSHPAIAKHLSEADPATVAMHFFRPRLASGRVAA